MKQSNGSTEKIAYVPMSVDLVHTGHINIINEAKKYGKVIVGLLTDKAVANYKRVPLLPYEQRKIIIESVKGVDEVVPQEEDDYVPIIKRLKPDYFIHGDDWKTGSQKEKRERVINAMKEIGGQVVEPAYTQGISSTQLNQSLREIGFTPEIRMKRLRRLLEAKPIIRILEAHNGLTGNIIENTKIEEDHMIKEFDGSWISSLTDSLSKGKPDTEIVDFTSRLNTINQVLETTTKPIIVDGDTGGLTEHFVSMVKTLERLGVSAIIVEDKVGSKKNSLFGTEANQEQDTIENFAYKIREGNKAQITQDFMIIARIESLILKKGMWDALLRARAYIESGADAIMIHSKEKDFKEIADFCKEYKKFERKVPLVAVPSTYSHVTEKELAENGINIVIYANHLLRAAYPAMLNTAKSILLNERAYEMEDNLFKINELIKLIEK